MQNKKLMVIPMLLVFALVMTGFAYAHWEKIITINGTVNTGILDLIIISAVSGDPSGTIDPGKDKNVATTTVTIDPTDPEILIVTITNAYPSYFVFVHFTVRNVGTIPVKLQAIEVEAPECITVDAWDSIGEQIDPYAWGGPAYKYQKDNSMYVHVEQSAEQGTTYTFTAKFIYVNWNEYVPP